MSEETMKRYRCSICDKHYEDYKDAQHCEEQCKKKASVSYLYEKCEYYYHVLDNEISRLENDYFDKRRRSDNSCDFWRSCAVTTWLVVAFCVLFCLFGKF